MRIVIAFLLIMVGLPAMADPVEGVWKTQPGDDGDFGHVRISTCGDKICGVLIAAFDPAGAPRDSDNLGKNIVWDMVPAGGGKYRGGKIWAPDRDKTYNSKMVLDGDILNVSGCILVICRAQVWTRAN